MTTGSTLLDGGYGDQDQRPGLPNTTTLTTIPLGLQQFQGIHTTYFNQQMAGCVISMIPGVVLVIALQRYLVDGISITGMAGR